jgi:DNA polymerase-3 subunit epsilon
MNYLVLDLETANPDIASICQVGIVTVEEGEIVGKVSHLVDPEDRFDYWNIKVHGIEPHHVVGAATFPDIWQQVAPLIEGRIVVTHGSFDRQAIRKACARYGLSIVDARWLDNQTVVRRTWSAFAKRGYSLGNLASHLGISFRHHDALEDAVATAHVFRRALQDSGKTASQWSAEVAAGSGPRSAIVCHGESSGPHFGKTIVFTGRLKVTRNEASRLAAQAGFSTLSTVSPQAHILCVGAGGRSSGGSKEREAARLSAQGHSVSVVTEDEFWKLIQT